MMEDADDGDVRNVEEGGRGGKGRVRPARATRIVAASGLILCGLFLVMTPVLAGHGVPVRGLLAAGVVTAVAWIVMAVVLAAGSRK